MHNEKIITLVLCVEFIYWACERALFSLTNKQKISQRNGILFSEGMQHGERGLSAELKGPLKPQKVAMSCVKTGVQVFGVQGFKCFWALGPEVKNTFVESPARTGDQRTSPSLVGGPRDPGPKSPRKCQGAPMLCPSDPGHLQGSAREKEPLSRRPPSEKLLSDRLSLRPNSA